MPPDAPCRNRPLRRAGAVPRGAVLIGAACGYMSPDMKPVFDIDDRTRLPWRFYGESLSVNARL